MKKHIELDKATVEDIIRWKRRARKPTLLASVRDALEMITKQNGHVSYVERMPVAQIKNFYTLWDDEIVGQFYINFNDDSITFLHQKSGRIP